MPYIVTTRGPSGHWAKVDPKVSRRAVATLDEAHALAYQHFGGEPGHFYSTITVDGGTIGPASDGTVIEVEPVTAGELTVRANIAPFPPAIPLATVVDAFNAQEVS